MDLTADQVRQMGLNPDADEYQTINGVTYRLQNNGRGGRTVSEASGGGGGGGGSYPAFNFDWTKAREEAMTQLTPYYEQKLAEAKGDVERAKKLIEEDYARGNRYRTEDLETYQGDVNLARKRLQEDFVQGEQYRSEDLSVGLSADALAAKGETRDAVGNLNQRGVLLAEKARGDDGSQAGNSQYASEFVLNPLDQKQQSRKQAIERAIKRQSQVAGIDKLREEEDISTRLNNYQRTVTRQGEEAGVERNRGLEEQDTQFPRIQRTLEEEKRSRAFNEVAPMKYQEAYTKYQSALG